MNEIELWYVFKKWGDVREVFIARNRNKWGKRYGFVRFKGVKDAMTLERKLDSLVVGGLKMHVNVSKHGRERIIRGEDSRGPQQEKLKPPQYMNEAASYAHVLMMESKKPDTRRTQPTLSSVGPVSHSSVQLNIPVDENTWLNRTWVGRLRKLTLFDRIEDDLMWIGYDGITPKYIGDDMVLLMGLTETNATQMAEERVKEAVRLFFLQRFQEFEQCRPKLDGIRF